MGMAEDDGIQGLHVEGEGFPVSLFALVSALQQAAIEQHAL